jgi:hypothetical protein
VNFWCSIFSVCTHSSMKDFFSKLLNCIGIKAKASALLQHKSNACIGLHNAPIHTTAGSYIRAVGSSFRLGGLKARAEGPRKFLNLESLKCHFLDFGEDLTEFLWSELNSVLVCRNLQFSSTKWAKAFLINYIDKLQESMGNIFILCSLHVMD